jgi:hypothetical protein
MPLFMTFAFIAFPLVESDLIIRKGKTPLKQGICAQSRTKECL